MRRIAMIALSFTLTLGLCAAGRIQAQDPKKDDPKTAPKPTDTKPADIKPADTKPVETKATETKPAAPTEAPLPPIPPAVEAKRQAAIKAVAEYIVDAQDAGLVETTIDPPPIVDLLATGRATDMRDLKAGKGVSPEVFGGWFTRQNIRMEGLTAQGDVRIFQPSLGLQELYTARANVLTAPMETYRKAKAAAAPKPVAPPPDTKKAAETKPVAPQPDTKKAAETKPAAPQPEMKKAAEPKPAEPKPAPPPETKPAPPPEAKKPATPTAETKPDAKKGEPKPAESKPADPAKKPGL